MVKKLILICLVGLLGIVGLSGPAWAYAAPGTTFWIAQMETPHRTVPSEQQPRSNKQTETAKPDKQPSNQQTTTNQQSPSVKARSQDKPFNPYDMKALKQFDAGDHRTK